MKYFSLDKNTWGHVYPSVVAILFSALYLGYLSLVAQPVMVYDSIGYEELGNRLYREGLTGYLKDGLTREPMYPLLLAVAMGLSDATGIAYSQIQKWIQVILLLISQGLLAVLLGRMGMKRWMIAMAVVGFGLMPSVVNSSLWTYSEIVTYPLVILLVLWGGAWIKEASDKDISVKKCWLSPLAVGFCCSLLTLVKAAFELVVPVMLFVMVLFVILRWSKRNGKVLCRGVLTVMIAATAYYAPLLSYKWMNWKQNGYFALTDRGPWALYGFTVRRMQPLSPQRVVSMMAYIPGPEFCSKVLSDKDCYEWSIFPGNKIAEDYLHEKKHQFANEQLLDHHLMHESLALFLKNPFKFMILMYVESFKALFWASDYDSQVVYPDWLEQVYKRKGLFMAFIILVALVTMVGYIYYMKRFIIISRNIFKGMPLGRDEPYVIMIVVLTNVFIASYAIIHVSPRDTLPVVALYVVMVAQVVSKFLWPKPSLNA